MTTLDKLLIMNEYDSFNISSIVNVYESFVSSSEWWIHQSILPQFLENAIICGNEHHSPLVVKGLSEAIIQSCLSPSMLPDNTYQFKMRDEIVSIEGFVTILLQFLELKFGEEKSWNLLSELRKFKSFLIDSRESNPAIQLKGLPIETTNYKNDNNESNSGYSQKLSYTTQPRKLNSAFLVDEQKSLAHQSFTGGVPVGIEFDDSEQHDRSDQVEDFRARPHFRRPDCQKKLLALIRKQGMDILFPMNTHDKVLSCIFVALRWNVALAHKELIDLVILVKDSKKVTQLDSVTKTKIRGLLSLLKNAEVLTTHGLEGTPVLLALHPSVQSFEDLRRCHDNFIHLFALQSFSQFSVEQLHEILWPSDAEERTLRAAAIAEFSRQLVEFLKETVKPPTDPLSMASVLTFDNAPPTLQQHSLAEQVKPISAESVSVPTPQTGGTVHPSPGTGTGTGTGVVTEGKLAKQSSIDQFIDLGMYVSESGSWSSDRADGFVDMLQATMEEENIFVDSMNLGDNPLHQPSEYRFPPKDFPSMNPGKSGNKVATSMLQFPKNISYERHHQSFYNQTRPSNTSRQSSQLGINNEGQLYPPHQGHRSIDLTSYRNLGTVPLTTNEFSYPNVHHYDQQQYLGLQHQHQQQNQQQSQAQSHHQHRYHSNSLSTLRQSPVGSLFDRQQHLQQGKGKSFSHVGYAGGSGGLSSRKMSMMRPNNREPVLGTASGPGVFGGTPTSYPPRHNGAPNSLGFSSGLFPSSQHQHQHLQPTLLLNRNNSPLVNLYFDHNAVDNVTAFPSPSPSSSSSSGRATGIGYNSLLRGQIGVEGAAGAGAGELPSVYYDLDGDEDASRHSMPDGNDVYSIYSQEGRRGMSSSSQHQQQQQQQQQLFGNRSRPVPRLSIPEGREASYDPTLMSGLSVSSLQNASPNSISGRSSFFMQEEMKEKFREQSARGHPPSYPTPPPLPSWFLGHPQGNAVTGGSGSGSGNHSFFSEDPLREGASKEREEKSTVDGDGGNEIQERGEEKVTFRYASSAENPSS